MFPCPRAAIVAAFASFAFCATAVHAQEPEQTQEPEQAEEAQTQEPEPSSEHRLWHLTIGAGYDMPQGDAGDFTDDDYSALLGVVLAPAQQALSYYADFQYSEYDLAPEVVDFFQAQDGSIRRYSVSTGVQWTTPARGAFAFYANVGIAGHYLDFNLDELAASTAVVCEPWWWWCVSQAGVGEVAAESEGTTRLGYSAGLGVDLRLGDSGKLFLEGRHNWVELDDTIRYVSVMFGYRW